MDKLAEEILRNEFDDIGQVYYVAKIIKAMQAYHEAKMKEELIKYTIWHEDKLFKCHALEEAIEHGVDEYLKQRNNDR